MNKKLKKNLYTFISLAVISTFYTNCGGKSENIKLADDTAIFSSLGECDGPMVQKYKETYYPFVRRQCITCHEKGPGLGFFADANIAKAWLAFEGASERKVFNNATTNHNPPYTGSQNLAEVQTLSDKYNLAHNDYLKCKLASGSTVDAQKGQPLQTTAKKIAATNNFTKISWNLGTEVAVGEKFPATLTVEIKKMFKDNDPAGTLWGYQLRNITLQVNPGNLDIFVTKINFDFNGQKDVDFTMYEKIDNVGVRAGVTYNLTPSSLYADGYTIRTVDPADTISLEMGAIRTAPLNSAPDHTLTDVIPGITVPAPQ